MGPPASLYGLRLAPCDPLILAVHPGRMPLTGLTGHVDWRIGGRISDLVRDGVLPESGPLLLPASPFLPTGRLLLWSPESVTIDALKACLRDLKAERPGLCPAELGLDATAVRRALGKDAVLYSAEGED
jgi:hypothetical protein